MDSFRLKWKINGLSIFNLHTSIYIGAGLGSQFIELRWSTDESRFWVKESLLSEDLVENEDLQYQGLLAGFLVSNILLQRGVDFPMPPDMVEKHKGVFQHHISGTGYKQMGGGSPKRRWWQFWRKL